MQKNEINVADVWWFWWGRRKLIGLCALYGLAAGVAVAFLWPKRYTAVVKVVAESQQESISSKFSGLESLLGIQINNLRPEEYLATELYPDIVASTPFLTEMGRLKVGENPLAVHVPGIHGSVDTLRPHRLLERLRKHIEVFTDNKSGLTTVSVTLRDPAAAAVAADSLTARLERYLIDTRTRKAREDLAFAEARFEEAKTNYHTAQEAYARFSDANRHLTSEAATVERNRLYNEQQLTYNLYSQLANQMELARIRVQERTPVLTMIEPAAVPARHSSPKRKLIVLTGLLLGAAVPMAWIFGGWSRR